MKLGKVIVVFVFALAVCWGIQKFTNLGGTVFSLASVPISGTMLVFCGAVGLCAWMMKR